jgi:hypothetical protein
MPSARGIRCPDHPGARLLVTTTRTPLVGLVVRYKRCAACGRRFVTEERPAPNRNCTRA